MDKKEVADIVRQSLKDREWRFDEKKWDSGEVTFRTGVTSSTDFFKGYDINIICRELDVQAIFFLPVKVPPKYSSEVSEYMSRLNSICRLGKWAYDYENSEVRWDIARPTNFLKECIDDVMNDLLDCSRSACDNYAVGILWIVLGLKTAEEAFDEIQRKSFDMPAPGTSMEKIQFDSEVVAEARAMSDYADIEIDPRLSFGEFLVRPSNSFAHAAARGIAESKIDIPTLCLFSGSGCGKTHLLNSIANLYQERNPTKKVVLTSAVRMLEKYLASLQTAKLARFRQHYRSADMLIIDDIEALRKSRQFREELFNTINVLLSEKKQVVFASVECPTRLDLEKRLIDRITSGLIVEIEEFTPDERVEFLKGQFQKAGVALGDANFAMIAESAVGNGAELMRIVKAISFAYEQNNGESSKIDVRKVLASCGADI